MLGRCARLLLFSAALALLSAATARAGHAQADAARLDPRLSASAAAGAERLASLFSDGAAERPLASHTATAATPAPLATPLGGLGESETELAGTLRIEQLLDAEPRRGPPPRIAETRIGGLELPGTTRIEGDAALTDSTQRGCGSSWLERASGFAFEVEVDHSYLVRIGDDGPNVWVHNAGLSRVARRAAARHKAWARDVGRISKTAERLGRRALRRSGDDWVRSERIYRSLLEGVENRLRRAGSIFGIEWQPAAIPGIGRVPAFRTFFRDGKRWIFATKGSRRLDAGIIDLTSPGPLRRVVSGFDITLDAAKPNKVRYYQEAFGQIPIADIR